MPRTPSPRTQPPRTQPPRTFVGFGFGAIQAGLFLAEAHLSGNFERLVVAEVLPDVVEAVRAAGAFTVNIGQVDRIEALTVPGVEIYRPDIAAERARLAAAVAEAGELATALPSVDLYGGPAGGEGEADIAAILAAGLRRKAQAGGPLAVVYTAENNTHAAAILRAAVLLRVPPEERAGVLQVTRFLDTVIGKMSGAAGETADLAPLAPGLGRAYLVEAFNRILIDQIARPEAAAQPQNWAEYRRGIEVFVEKPDLRPFAEAKLYGHNAGHALAAYLAHQLGFTRIDQLAARPDVLRFVAATMRRESGVALCRRYAHCDPLFTRAGFRAYVDDLLARMLNPYVRDSVARVGRDPARKLGWDDRLIGAMRLAAAAGAEPQGYALGAAAALAWLGVPAADGPAYLRNLWRQGAADGYAPDAQEEQAVLNAVARGRLRLQTWAAAGFPPLTALDEEQSGSDI